ncbi:MAG: preprotein translocase subunit SecG [Endomicrobiia bacterium]|nr:preprotein translocase subunit SecG [Endomicrobiia bacterium]
MYNLISALHIFASAALILIILFQSGKGAGLAGLFGGQGGADQLFSAPSGGSFLRKATITLAVLFVLTSLSLTLISSRRHYESVAATERQ